MLLVIGLPFLDKEIRLDRNTVSKFAVAVDSLHKSQFYRALSNLIRATVDFSDCSVWYYRDIEAPQRLYDHNSSEHRDFLHQKLLRAAYLIGPYYSELVRNNAVSGFYPIDELIPDGFSSSEYYRSYYEPKCVVDEGMFFIRLTSDRSVGVLIERSAASEKFTNGEKISLDELVQLVESLVIHHQHEIGVEVKSSRSTVTTALESFGASKLSDREREICALILKGHSSKSGARILGISPETERVYRKRLYGKLGVVSQGELFWLFIRAAESYDPVQHTDPLEAVD